MLLSEATKVFDGTVNFRNEDWVQITFDTPFFHDYSKNLVVITCNKTGSYNGCPKLSAYQDASYHYVSISNYSDSDSETQRPNADVGYSSMSYSKNHIILHNTDATLAKITYKANGIDSPDIVQQHISGKSVVLQSADAFARTGYIIKSWNTKADGSGNTYAVGAAVSWQSDVTLYAQWEQLRSITYKANGGSGSDYVQYHRAGEQATIAERIFSREDYVFIGWNSKADGSGNTYAAGTEVTWSSNVTLYAIWKPLRTITYKANGGSGSDRTQSHGAGIAINLLGETTFGRSGYYLASWNSKENGSGNDYAPGQTVTWMSDVTLWAKWAAYKTITYKANGGSGTDIVQNRKPGETTALESASSFSRPGYSFICWNTKADGTGNNYEAGQEIAWMSDVTLYAKWGQQRVITYKANGGEGSDVSQYHIEGDKTALKSGSIFTREGYIFAGWNSKANGSGNTYKAGQVVSWNDNVTLYAVWKPKRTVTYMKNDGSTGSGCAAHALGEPYVLGYGIYPFTRSGYYFTGWNTKADGTGNTYAMDTIVTWSTDVTLYAQWKPAASITYKANDGSDREDVNYHAPGESTELGWAGRFSRDGYAIASWNTKADGTGNSYAPETIVTWSSNVTLYAQWKPARTITFYENGGLSRSDTLLHGAGTKVNLYGAYHFDRAGYTITGWNTKADGTGNTYAPGAQVAWSENVTLYAVWQPAKSITYKKNDGSDMGYALYHLAGVKTTLMDEAMFEHRPGYVLTGWNSKADGTGNTYAPGAEVTWSSDVTLYAQWAQNKAIIYKANGAGVGDETQVHGAGVKTALKAANTFTRSGYIFCGWNSKADGTGNTYAAGAEVTWLSDVTLYAIWKAERTITYKGNGASSGDVVQKHGAGEKIKLYGSSYKRTGYVFVNWNTKADGSGNTYVGGQEVAWNDNVTLYAQWKPARTITYKANGGTGADVVQTHGAGVKTALNANTFTKSGYVFCGWNSKADGTGNTYAAGAEVTWSENVTLYAIWKPARTITYKANGAAGADVVQTHGAGVKTALKAANTFTKSGYVFCGWNGKADGSGNTYAAGAEVTWSENVTLYAIWKPARTITYKANGGTGADVVQTHGAGVKVALKANSFTRTGYTFNGWNSKADGSGNTYAAGAYVTWIENVTLYAQWKQNQAKITYKANGGTGSDVTQTHGAGSKVAL